jgi:hypothetical protein
MKKRLQFEDVDEFLANLNFINFPQNAQ